MFVIYSFALSMDQEEGVGGCFYLHSSWMRSNLRLCYQSGALINFNCSWTCRIYNCCKTVYESRISSGCGTKGVRGTLTSHKRRQNDMNSFLAHDYDGYAQEIIMSKFLSQQVNIVSHAMVLAVVTEEGKYRGCKINSSKKVLWLLQEEW